MVVRRAVHSVYDRMNKDPLSWLPNRWKKNKVQLDSLKDILQWGNSNQSINNFIDALTPVEFYKYCETLKSAFLVDEKSRYGKYEGDEWRYISDDSKIKLQYGWNDVTIDELFLSFMETNKLYDLWNDKRGSYFFKFLRSIGSWEKNVSNLITSEKEWYSMWIDDAKIILKTFFEFLKSNSVWFPNNTKDDIISEEQFFDKVNNDFKLTIQNVAHRYIAMRMKKLQPILKIINANPKFKEILKKYDSDQHNSARKIKSRISVDERTYKQLTFFFEKLSNDEKLANLFYEYAMEVARNESKIRWKRLKEKSNRNETVEFEAIHIWLGINWWVLSEAHRKMYPHISTWCLTIGREEHFGTNFNFGWYLKKAFATNSRRRSANANELPWPTYESALNDGWPHAIIDETNIGSSEYGDDATWWLEIFVKHFFHSNHLFNCDIISQEEDFTGNGYSVMLRDRNTNEVVVVKSKKNVFTTGLGIQKMWCKKPTKETFDMEKRTENFNPDRIYREVLAWMNTPEYKNKQPWKFLPSFKSRFPSVPPRITIEQLLILAKYPGFPFEAFVEWARILFPWTWDSTKIALERIYLNTSSRSKKNNYIEPLSYVVWSDMNYKEELRPEIRARYAPLINKVATSKEKTNNYKIIPLQWYVMNISNNGNKNYNNYDYIDRYAARVEVDDKFILTNQIEDEVVWLGRGQYNVNFDLMVDCSGFDGSYLSSVLKTRETEFSRKTYERVIDEGPSLKFYEEDESIMSLDAIGRRGSEINSWSITNNATDNPSELAKKRESIWKKLKYSLVKDPDFLTRFYLYNDSRFEVRYADSNKVILWCYNNNNKSFEEFIFYRNDFENIFDLKYKKNEVNFERFSNVMIRSTPIDEVIRFLWIPNQYRLFDEVKEERCYQNTLKKQNNLISKEVYEDHKNTIINQLIKSVFNQANKKEIQLFTRIIDACYNAGGGTIFLWPTWWITTPDFSKFEKILLDDSLGIGENTAARFRYWWRIYSYVYDNYDEKFILDAKIASWKIEADGADLLDTKDESIFKTSFTDTKIKLQSVSNRYKTNAEESQYIRMFQNSDYTYWDSYFWWWFFDLIRVAKINPSDYWLSKTEYTQYLQKLRIVYKKDIKWDNNTFSIESDTNNKTNDGLNKYLQCLLSYNSYEGKNITEYLIYLAKEFGEDGVIDLQIPLIIDNGVLTIDVGWIDKKAYEDEIYQAKLGSLKRKAIDTFSDSIAKVLWKSWTRKTKTNVKPSWSQVWSKLKSNSARFGFYNPWTNQKVA